MDEQVKESKVSRAEYEEQKVSEDPDVDQSPARAVADPARVTGETEEDNPTGASDMPTEDSPADAPGVQQVKPINDAST
ncbi:MAG: hypothetical protein HC840_07265 [Leptolyngbyaceae cyanobacterium RM2_2_4]|nr:hypothetical protein [Leptolyngbyaceae cyanobacterium SM1_4_3]NJN89723.1 hypothetical protein [Leptolyngbyaceae cyanobacterium SL_5_14]NJO49274.1 hypothetical protein [Leptolyngbyaceae cyanobacterium RM2_2_4]